MNAAILSALSAILLFPATAVPEEAPLTIFVSIPPQKYFVQRVGGERVRVEALVRPGQDPHTYEPTPRQMAALAGARAYFRIGVPFENALLPRLAGSLAGLRIVDTRRGIALREMEDCRGDERGDENDHGGPDPHIWLSPALVREQARTICAALSELDPPGREDYEAGLVRFLAELEGLDRRLAAALAPARDKSFMVFHPAWGYFAHAYGLRQVPIEMGGKTPSARQLARIIDRAREEGIRVIFVQPQFDLRSAQAVAEAIGGAVVPIDSLAENYPENLAAAAAAILAGVGR